MSTIGKSRSNKLYLCIIINDIQTSVVIITNITCAVWGNAQTYVQYNRWFNLVTATDTVKIMCYAPTKCHSV